MKETRDGLNFGEMHVPRLFRKLFIPTLLGLLAGVLLTLADGIAVGRGVGSDALAAVNVAAPVYMITTGLALMFGSGVSIVASTHLAKGNRKAANINVTQAFLVPTLIMLAVVIILNLFPSIFCILLGGSEKLFPYVKEYWQYVSPALVMLVILTTGLFVARIDGAPNFGMMVNVIVAIINIILDYLLVFPLDMGIKGAALATSAATTTGAVAMLWYFTRHSRILRLYRIKLSQTSLRLTRRNCNYMVKLGMPTFVAETAMTCMMVVGNFMFMSRLQEDGVAAFSVACYLFPLVFMFGNAIAQSALPIVSYNHALGSHARVKQAFRISMTAAMILGLAQTLLVYAAAPSIVSVFIGSEMPAHSIGVAGLPLFAATCLFFTLNIVLIGYYQSMEYYRLSTTFMVLRGYVLIIPSFLFLPSILNDKGLWLAVPLSELLTLLLIVSYEFVRRLNLK